MCNYFTLSTPQSCSSNMASAACAGTQLRQAASSSSSTTWPGQERFDIVWPFIYVPCLVLVPFTLSTPELQRTFFIPNALVKQPVHLRLVLEDQILAILDSTNHYSCPGGGRRSAECRPSRPSLSHCHPTILRNSPFGLFSLRIVSGAASLLLLQQQTGRLDQTDTSFFCLIQGQQLETKPGNSLAMRTKRKLKVQTATNQAHVWRHQEQAQGMR